ncbi:hypothetical protein F5B19DRAFT_437244 [Rostrohypoxylon terebratum]|nr:hypothetical protein F5B19DRAFT_437244 [Rostrohypoxylon terebratum]
MGRLLKIYAAMTTTSSIDKYGFAKAVIKLDLWDEGLELVQLALSRPNSQSKRSKKKIDELFIMATNFGHLEIARFLATTFALKYSSLSLQAAILSHNPQMIDEVISSGVSPNFLECGNFEKPLDYALEESPENMVSAFRLIYHGADYTHVGDYQKDQLWDELLYVDGFKNYILNTPDNKLRVTPNRLTFAKSPKFYPKKSRGYFRGCNSEYVKQVHAMACLVLRNEYWEEFKRRAALHNKGKYKAKRAQKGYMTGKLCKPEQQRPKPKRCVEGL